MKTLNTVYTIKNRAHLDLQFLSDRTSLLVPRGADTALQHSCQFGKKLFLCRGMSRGWEPLYNDGSVNC